MGSLCRDLVEQLLLVRHAVKALCTNSKHWLSVIVAFRRNCGLERAGIHPAPEFRDVNNKTTTKTLHGHSAIFTPDSNIII